VATGRESIGCAQVTNSADTQPLSPSGVWTASQVPSGLWPLAVSGCPFGRPARIAASVVGPARKRRLRAITVHSTTTGTGVGSTVGVGGSGVTVASVAVTVSASTGSVVESEVGVGAGPMEGRQAANDRRMHAINRGLHAIDTDARMLRLLVRQTVGSAEMNLCTGRCVYQTTFSVAVPLRSLHRTTKKDPEDTSLHSSCTLYDQNRSPSQECMPCLPSSSAAPLLALKGD
jgi:hypothetical protein